MFYGNTKTAAAFAQLLGKWRDALDDDVRLYSLVVPHASSYYAPSNYSYLLDYAERSFDVIADNMPAGVEYVDVYNLFKSHLDEPIYPRTEHHWNALAAYYAVGELCRLAGVSYPELSAFPRGSAERLLSARCTRFPKSRRRCSKTTRRTSFSMCRRTHTPPNSTIAAIMTFPHQI